jgi:CO/xanthine dehydrogenase Mo-binding subunit
MVQNIAALHLGLKEFQVRVICKDVGGSFGIKVHIYADEMATYALSKLLRRPIKFVADRVESFNTDIHARDHRCKGKIGVNRDGAITAFEIDDLTGIGPYSMYPRTSAIEANQKLPRPCPCGVPEQERYVPVPRRRPSDRLLGDGRPGRSGGDEDRHGPGRDPPPQPDCR